jgi:hypothetical protein
VVHQGVRVVGSACQYHRKGSLPPTLFQQDPSFRLKGIEEGALGSVGLLDCLPDEGGGDTEGPVHVFRDLDVPGALIEPMEKGGRRREPSFAVRGSSLYRATRGYPFTTAHTWSLVEAVFSEGMRMMEGMKIRSTFLSRSEWMCPWTSFAGETHRVGGDEG